MIKIGTRDSKLAIWQAEKVQQQLAAHGHASELVFIKSEGDIDLKTPLYAMGVQGVFTRSLDIALLNKRIDIAVHSMKDVPTQLPQGIVQAAVLKRGPVNDLLVFKTAKDNELYQQLSMQSIPFSIATSSIRRKAQWLHRFPAHGIDNLRGNVITRLDKLANSSWNAAIFAQAGLERIDLRPEQSLVIDWMLPAPAQGAVMVVCREEDINIREACSLFNDEATALCTKAERDFLKKLMGGCSTPISALATIENDTISFKGSLLSLDGKKKIEVAKEVALTEASCVGTMAAEEILQQGGDKLVEEIRNAG